MLDPSELAVLAKRTKQASENQQFEILVECFEAVLGPIKTQRGNSSRYHDQWLRFDKLLKNSAYETAAMLLIPEGKHLLLSRAPDGSARALLTDDEPTKKDLPGAVNAVHAGLAIAAAAVLATASRE
ncbi:hypothetical protein [Erythrobacter aureus]|uniref:Uncharacterized protein n=1 Tax=Erythrobacter aureus TaxID=2182384 RepID=A0A345YJD8_9SPHN|nr:hypothetical protein [Erythrobacter aureus]AXK44040.1 hypothetical protein DVR09_16435 [Erythrobacter aureus]